MALKIRRGSDTERTGIRFDQGEIVWVTSTTTSRPAYKLYVGDGTTFGGKDILETSAGNKLSYNSTTGRLDVSGLTTDDVTEGLNRKYFSKELAQDAIAEMFGAGTMSGIQFQYDDLNNKMNVTVTATGGGGGGGGGITQLLEDPSPQLGGSLDLNSQIITGSGNIDITGNLIASGTLEVSGLGVNLDLNSYNITGLGSIDIDGAISASDVLAIPAGLGSNLPLNGYSINGAGDINTDGNITITGDISAVGAISATGNLSTTGTLSFNGLGNNINLNVHDITGSGNIDIIGSIEATGNLTGSIVTAKNIVLNQDLTAGGIFIETNTGGDTGADLLTIRSYHNEGTAAGTFFFRARGTASSPTALVNGDPIFSVGFLAQTSSTTAGVSSGIVSEVAGSVSAGVAPGKVAFWTTETGGTFSEKFAVGPDGKQEIHAPALTAGGSSGQVNIGSISSWMKVTFNGVDYAVPMYEIRP
jgi:hypothetical protein